MIKTKKAWYLFAMAGVLAGCTVSYSSPSNSAGATATSGFSSTSPALATMNALRTAFIEQTAQSRGLTPGGEATNTPSSFATVAITPTVGQYTPAFKHRDRRAGNRGGHHPGRRNLHPGIPLHL